MASNADPIFFHDTQNPPPGGFFYETHGERVRRSTFIEIEPIVRALMAKYHIPGTPEMEVAAYMCPRLDDPGRYCRGKLVEVPHTRAKEAFENSIPYVRRRVVTFDRIARRENICTRCPKHQRDWCPTCTGHPAQLSRMFGDVRPDLPEDKVTGVCSCARAYEFALASVEYRKDEKIWEGAPDTCWRFHDV